MYKRNCHVYHSPILHESRIEKICETLISNGVFSEIHIIGITDKLVPKREILKNGITIFRYGTSLTSNRFINLISYYALTLAHIIFTRADVISVHSVFLLPMAFMAKLILWKTKIVYETHELESETSYPHSLKNKITGSIEKLLISKCDHICVVGDEIRKIYISKYFLQEDKITTIYNYPKKTVKLEHSGKKYLQSVCKIKNNNPIFLYQGVIDNGRGINMLLECFAVCPELNLVLLGYGNLFKSSKEFSSKYENIHVLNAVPTNELYKYTASADFGLCLIEKMSNSYYYCLPNKLFEYLNAGIPIIASDFPEIRRYLSKTKSGWVIKPKLSDLKILLKENISLNSPCVSNAIKNKNKFYFEQQTATICNIYLNSIEKNR